jgi:hypothetical protein
VVNPVEKFLEIEVHDPAVSVGLVLLRLHHRYLRRAAWPESPAMLGKRRVPLPLKNL